MSQSLHHQRDAPPKIIPFSYSDIDPPINLYPVIKDGANINILSEYIPGNFYAKNHQGKLRPTALYYRLYRYLNRLEKNGILTKEKGIQDAGLGDRPSLWWRPSLKFLTTDINPLNLIKRAQNSNQAQTRYLETDASPDYQGPKWMKIPKRSNPKRISAALRLMEIKTRMDHWLYIRKDSGKRKENGDKILILQPELVKRLQEPEKYYHNYLTEIATKNIMLVPRGEKEHPNPSTIKFIPYRTRFNDPGRRRRNLDNYDYAWSQAETDYSNGIYLTLTTDPAMHDNLWAANRHCSPAWNRYISKIQKQLKVRPKYIKVVEYQENGLIHLHCVFFGINRLHNISAEWENTGQGRITKAIPISLDENHSWQWSGKRPTDAKDDESVSDYLKKYLKKSVFNPEDLFLYWACNSKFFTCSQSFSPPASTEPTGPPQWDYLGTAPSVDLPQWVTYIATKPQPIEIGITDIPITWEIDNPYKSRKSGFKRITRPTIPRPTAGGPADRLNLADFM